MGMFFVPANKVQKDRTTLRAIDKQMAEKSLPGTPTYFLVYLLIDFLLGFPEESRLISYTIGLSILAITAARIYYILRFESVYPKGPAKWRDQFLALTLCNAMVWSSLQVYVLLNPDFAQATILTLVYSAALTAGVSLTYATYSRFVRWYLAIVIIPPAAVLLFRMNLLDAVLANGMVVYLVFLIREAQSYHQTFWSKVENQYLLEQKLAVMNATKLESDQRADISENVLHTIMQLIKTPLQGVLGMMSLLANTRLDSDQRQALEVASQSGDALVGLISDLEDYTKLRSGNLQPESKFFDLRKYTESQMELLGPVSHQRGLELSYLYNLEVPSRVKLDKKQIGQVIRSQVQFALNTAHTGEVVFKVSAIENAKVGQVLRFCVYFQSHDIDVEEVQNRIHNLQMDSVEHLDAGLLSLMIATRLATLMGGDQELKLYKQGHYILTTYVPLTASSQQIDPFQPDKTLQEKSLVLAYLPERGAKGLAAECHNWGMETSIVNTSDALRMGLQSQPDFVLFNLPVTDDVDQIIHAIRELTEWNLDKTKVIFYGAVKQKARLSEVYPDIRFLAKPGGRYALHKTLLEVSDFDDHQVPVYDGIGRKKILLAEDNKVNRMVTESILKKLGFDFYTVEDGQKVVEELRQRQYDLVLMDCVMPVLDGVEAAKQVRLDEEENELNQVPIVALTAKNAETEERVCLAAGMNDFISKPVTLGDLDATLRRWLG